MALQIHIIDLNYTLWSEAIELYVILRYTSLKGQEQCYSVYFGVFILVTLLIWYLFVYFLRPSLLRVANPTHQPIFFGGCTADSTALYPQQIYNENNFLYAKIEFACRLGDLFGVYCVFSQCGVVFFFLFVSICIHSFLMI